MHAHMFPIAPGMKRMSRMMSPRQHAHMTCEASLARESNKCVLGSLLADRSFRTVLKRCTAAVPESEIQRNRESDIFPPIAAGIRHTESGLTRREARLRR